MNRRQLSQPYPYYIVITWIQNHKHAHTYSDIKHSDGGREERKEERRDGRKDGRNVGWMKRSEDEPHK